MQTKTLVVAVILSLSFLLAIPTAYITNVHAVTQSVLNARFSATGARATTFQWKVYATDTALLADFDAGLLDILDGPDQAGRLNCATNPACDENNPDYYVSNAQPRFDLEQLDISHQVNFLGIPEFCSRALGAVPVSTPAGFACTPGFAPQTPTLTINSDTVAACGGVSSNQFSLTIHLKNFEENLALITDPNEVITATPTAGTAASTSSSTGTYALGCLSNIPPAYTISTAVYGGLTGVAKGSITTAAPGCAPGFLCDVDFKVDYNSPSNKEPTVAISHIARALGHLVDKGNFRLDPVLQGAAVCNDIFSSPAQNIMNSISDPTTVCSASGGLGSEVTGPGSPAAAAAKSVIPNLLTGPAGECPELATANFPITTCTPASLYHLVSADIGACDGTVAAACAANSLGYEIPGTVGGVTVFPSAGRLGNDNVGGVHLPPHGYASIQDLIAACDEFALAGITVSGGNCNDVARGNVPAGATVTPHLNNFCAGTTTHCLIDYVQRKRNLPAPARPEWSTIVGDELDYLFGSGFTSITSWGGTVCFGTQSPAGNPSSPCVGTITSPSYYPISFAGPVVFQASNTFNIYSGSEDIGSTPDAVLFSVHSQFAGSASSGFSCVPSAGLASFPNDYDLWCDPETDTQSNAGEFSPSFSDSFKFFQNAALLTSARGYVNPIFTDVNRFLALNAFNTESLPNYPSSLVPATGRGFEGGGLGAYFTLLNMQPNGKAPTLAKFAAGGGVAGLVRRSSGGAAQGVLHQNIFTSTTVFEADLINELFDSPLIINPISAGSNLQLIDYQTKSHSSQFDALTGLNTQVFNFRSDLCWHDATVGPFPPAGQLPCGGQQLTADDFCFSIGVELKGPGLNFIAVQDVVSCTAADPQTAVVVHNGLSAFQDLNVGGQPVLPAHIWQTACGWVAASHSFSPTNPIPATVVNAPCTQAGFDPLAVTFNGAPFSTPLPANVDGMMVGDGPLMCVTRPGFANAGKIGGGCAVNPLGTALSGQALDVGATETFVQFPFYERCCDAVQGSPLQPLSWADFNKDGKVTIVDASALSFAFGTNDAADGGYFVNPQYGTPGDPNVDIGDAAFLASEFDNGVIAPCVAFQCPGPPTEPNPAAPLLSPDPATDPYHPTTGVETLGCTVNSGRTIFTCTFADKTNQLGGVVGTLDGTASVAGAHQANGQTTFTFPGNYAPVSHTFHLSIGGIIVIWYMSNP